MNTEPKEHNPDNLTPEQYGAPEWRLLTRDEVEDRNNQTLIDLDVQADCQAWCEGQWKVGYTGTAFGITYRRRATPSEDDDFPDIRRPGEVKRESELAELRAQLTAAKADWRMIDDADPASVPDKAGTYLIACEGGNVTDSYFEPGHLFTVGRSSVGKFSRNFEKSNLGYRVIAWMPRPLPPAPTAARAQETK